MGIPKSFDGRRSLIVEPLVRSSFYCFKFSHSLATWERYLVQRATAQDIREQAIKEGISTEGEFYGLAA
jgi:hypothetical protein